MKERKIEKERNLTSTEKKKKKKKVDLNEWMNERKEEYISEWNKTKLEKN